MSLSENRCAMYEPCAKATRSILSPLGHERGDRITSPCQLSTQLDTFFCAKFVLINFGKKYIHWIFQIVLLQVFVWLLYDAAIHQTTLMQFLSDDFDPASYEHRTPIHREYSKVHKIIIQLSATSDKIYSLFCTARISSEKSLFSYLQSRTKFVHSFCLVGIYFCWSMCWPYIV
jgi:hypothetical protein